MARVFISFAMEDRHLRDFLVGQKKNARTAIEFTDYSVNTAWASSWKTQCRERINSCRGMIGIVTPSTPKADGQIWELKCAIDQGMPLMLIHGYRSPGKKLLFPPSVISGCRINIWTEDNIIKFLNTLG